MASKGAILKGHFTSLNTWTLIDDIYQTDTYRSHYVSSCVVVMTGKINYRELKEILAHT